MSTKALVTSAASITTLIADFLSRKDFDITRIPSFMGYCAFTCGVIHLILYRTTGREPFKAHVQVALLLLNELAAYWPMLSSKVSKFKLSSLGFSGFLIFTWNFPDADLE